MRLCSPSIRVCSERDYTKLEFNGENTMNNKEMSKGDLHKASGLSSSTMTKLRKGEDVSMEALRKICICLDCNIGDIVEFVPDNTTQS